MQKGRRKINKGYYQQSEMMNIVMKQITDVDYYSQEAARERNMQNVRMLFCFDNTKQIYHDKTCVCVKEIPTKNILFEEKIKPNYSICSKCYRKAIIRQGMDDDNGKIVSYLNFFHEHNVASSVIKKITINRQGKFKILNDNYIQITINGEDIFKIEYSIQDNGFIIYHSNYIVQNNKRIILPGFHLEENSYDTLEDALIRIGNYSWNKYHKNKSVSL